MYEPCRSIDSFFIDGFRRYDGPTVLGDIAPGTALDLIGEPDNPVDPHAVRISLRGVKLGYVPKGKNELASLLAFYGHAGVLECRVTQVNPLADPWEQVRVGIFVTDARPLEQQHHLLVRHPRRPANRAGGANGAGAPHGRLRGHMQVSAIRLLGHLETPWTRPAPAARSAFS